MRLAVFLLATAMFGQTVGDFSKLPTYLAGGGAYNQLSGVNAWASGIFPVVDSIGLLASATTDILPVKKVIDGKKVYIFTMSARLGCHSFLHHGPKNSFLYGADGGASWSQGTALNPESSGFSGSFTVTYVRQLSTSWGAIFPFRAIYTPTLGGWNPIAEAGLVYTFRK